MLPSVLSGLGALALAASGVNAGSRAWESNIKHARAVHHETLLARDLAFQAYGNVSDAIKSRRTNDYDALPNAEYNYHNGSTRSIHKRWFGIEPDGGTLRLWPQGNIKVCFEDKMWGDKSTEKILRGPLEEARGLWKDKGVDDDRGWFKWDVQTDKTYCSDRNNRGDFLLVMYAGIGVEEMGTTPGMGPKLDAANQATSFEKLGPRMKLSDSLNMGHRNVVANYAHEMGHAWGFHHEHQNPDWWAQRWSGEERDTYFFGDGSFFCDRLSDYANAVAQVDATGYPDDLKAEFKRKLCTDRDIASRFQFTGGLNWLPVKEGTQFDKKREPDWTSIMIYPSTAGNGGAGDGKDNAIMLTKPDGDVIKPVTRVSSLDAEGLRKMYKGSPKKSIGRLISRKGSQFFNKFRQVESKDPDTACV